jgi:hypothetical protein
MREKAPLFVYSEKKAVKNTVVWKSEGARMYFLLARKEIHIGLLRKYIRRELNCYIFC